MYYNRGKMKKILCKTVSKFLLALFIFSPVFAFAASFSVSPLIVDEKAKKRDILKQTVTLTNNTEIKWNVYTTVKNIDRVDGEQEFVHRTKTDVTTSLAHWIEIPRMSELAPGETKRIPYLIQVHMNAVPGIYHAEIIFQEGTNRAEAEANKVKEVISVNLEVLDDSKERLQLGTFMSDKTFFTEGVASFSYLLENIGNRSVTPKGEIRIFNRRGEEIATIDVNSKEAALLPEATSQLGAVWNTDGAFGRYKALLDVEYGNKQRGTVHDTVFFWVVPWQKVTMLFVGIAIVLIIATSMLYNKYGGSVQQKNTLAYARGWEDSTPKANDTAKMVPGARIDNQIFSRAHTATSLRQTQKTTISKRQVLNTKNSFRQTKQPVQTKTFVAGQASHPVRLEKKQKSSPVAGAVVTLKKRGN
jgi:hypothetical protein